MKVRLGFVANSSSSSYVCVLCGEEQSGMDLSLSDIDMSCCECGHTMCNDHLIPVPDFKEEDYDDEDCYNIDSRRCPVCQFMTAIDEDIAELHLIDNHLTRAEYAEHLQERFGTYENFVNFIKETKTKLKLLHRSIEHQLPDIR